MQLFVYYFLGGGVYLLTKANLTKILECLVLLNYFESFMEYSYSTLRQTEIQSIKLIGSILQRNIMLQKSNFQISIQKQKICFQFLFNFSLLSYLVFIQKWIEKFNKTLRFSNTFFFFFNTTRMILATKVKRKHYNIMLYYWSFTTKLSYWAVDCNICIHTLPRKFGLEPTLWLKIYIEKFNCIR